MIYKIQRALGEVQKLLLRRVRFGKGVRFIGVANIGTVSGATITIADNVTINSSNHGYHANMATGVKLLVDRPGATISIGANSRLNGACIHAWREVSIGENCLLASGVQIMDANGHAVAPEQPALRLSAADTPRPVRIGNSVWLGMNVIVLPGSTIGDGSVIGANSVVSGVIPPGVVAVGQPAKPVKTIYSSN